MGVVIVGPSGSGKSAVWKILKSALNKLGQTVKDYTMNPKAMPRTQVHNLPTSDTFILYIFSLDSYLDILILILENGQMGY